jgi:hypothetical protein
LFAAFLAAAAVAVAPNSTLYSDAKPPIRHQRDATVVLQVADQAEIERICQPLFGTPPAGMKTDACQTGDRVVLPNPCLYPPTETYAHMLCHELGHANGWPRTHGD